MSSRPVFRLLLAWRGLLRLAVGVRGLGSMRPSMLPALKLLERLVLGKMSGRLQAAELASRAEGRNGDAVMSEICRNQDLGQCVELQPQSSCRIRLLAVHCQMVLRCCQSGGGLQAPAWEASGGQGARDGDMPTALWDSEQGGSGAPMWLRAPRSTGTGESDRLRPAGRPLTY